jgi:integrase
VHSRRCPLSTGRGRRCHCRPVYEARAACGQRTLRRTFATLAEAVAWAEASRDALRHGRPSPSSPRPGPSLQDLAVSFLHRAHAGQALTRRRRPYKPRTIEFYETQLRLHVLPHPDAQSGSRLGDLPATAIAARNAQSLVDTIAARNGAVLARHAAAALAAVLRDGYTRGLLDTLPPRLQLPPPPPARDRTLTPAEAERLLAAATADDTTKRRSLLAPLVALLLASGCRITEAVTLAWGRDGLDLDSDPPLITITADKTKTPAGARTLPIDCDTAALLRRHRLASGRPPDGSPVFPDQHGQRRTRGGAVAKGFARITHAAGLQPLSPHALRHTHASWLAAAGVPIPIAAKRLGHADGGALFMRVYTHPNANDQLAALQAVHHYRHRTPR